MVYLYWGANGQIGRYGVPQAMSQVYPGYDYTFQHHE